MLLNDAFEIKALEVMQGRVSLGTVADPSVSSDAWFILRNMLVKHLTSSSEISFGLSGTLSLSVWLQSRLLPVCLHLSGVSSVDHNPEPKRDLDYDLSCMPGTSNGLVCAW